MGGTTINHKGIAKLLRSDAVRDDLRERGQRVLQAARSNAPVRTGAYRDSLHLVSDTTDRAVVRIVADADHAPIVEANTGTLAQAMTAAGGDRSVRRVR